MENMKLHWKSKAMEVRCGTLVAVMSVEKLDLLDQVNELSNELVVVSVVEGLIYEVEIIAKAVESASKVVNADQGVQNKMPI